jgi:hypothetical protein
MAKTPTALASLLSVVFFVAAGRGDDNADLEKEIQKILAAKYTYATSDGPGVAKGYEDLFRRVGPAGIRELKKHKNPGVALRAAWEEVRLTIPEKRQVNQGPGMPVEADALERFLGFAKTRLAARVPGWWQRALLGAEAHRRDNIYFTSSQDDMYEDAGAGIRAKPGISIVRRGKELLATIGEDSIVLPEGIAENAGSRDHFSAGLASTYAYVALHPSWAKGYDLFRLDRQLGKVAWKTDVWAYGMRMFYLGPHFHNVTVIAQEQQVTVFGGSTGVLYVESFKAADGRTLYRFCTGY